MTLCNNYTPASLSNSHFPEKYNFRMINLAQSIRAHRHALRSQFMINIKSTVANTWLGPLWWILDPLVLMVIYLFLIKIVFKHGGPNYHIFILCGIVSWQSFSTALTISAKSLRSNASLIRQTSLPLQLYVLIPCIVQSFFYLVGMTIIACWNIATVGWHGLVILPLIIPMILLPLGLGLVLSILVVHLPDTGKFLPYVLRIGFFVSPILYSPDRIYTLENVPQILKTIYALNPMVHVITAVRDVLFTGKLFDLKTYAILVGLSLVLVQLSLWFFRRYAPQIPKAL